MKLADYGATQTFTEGFPQGDTHLQLSKCDFNDVSFPDENGKDIKRTLVKTQTGKEYFCPRSVLKALLDIQSQGKDFARVTRVGKTMNDTKYTVIAVDHA